MTHGDYEYFSLVLDTNGDSSGIDDAIGNYSDAGDGLTEFKRNRNGDTLEIHRLIIHYTDAKIDAGFYGDAITLTNGIKVQIRDTDDNTIFDLTNGLPIKTNANWGRVAYDTLISNFGSGAGDDGFSVRWTFSRAGTPIYLKNNLYFAVVLNDDFTGLVTQSFTIQGRYLNRNY